MARPTIALLTLHPAPYRLMLFEALAKDDDYRFVPLIVFKGVDQGRGAWPLPDPRRFSYRSAQALPLAFLRRRSNDPGGPLLAPAAFGELVRLAPDLVIYPEFGPTALLALAYARLFRKPLVLTTDASQEGVGPIGSLRHLQRRLMLVQTQSAIAICESGRRYLADLGLPEARTHLSPLVGDDRLFFPAADDERQRLRAELGLRGRCFLFVGRFEEIKRLDRLIAAFKRLPRENDTQLWLIGKGAQEAELKAQAHDCPAVRFLPLTPPAALRRYYAAADFLVLPSLGELWGLVVNEAMMCGTPAIVSAGAGANEMIAHGVNGLRFDPADSEALALALQHAATLPDAELAQWRRAAHATTQHYTIADTIRGLKAAVAQALEK